MLTGRCRFDNAAPPRRGDHVRLLVVEEQKRTARSSRYPSDSARRRLGGDQHRVTPRRSLSRQRVPRPAQRDRAHHRGGGGQHVHQPAARHQHRHAIPRDLAAHGPGAQRRPIRALDQRAREEPGSGSLATGQAPGPIAKRAALRAASALPRRRRSGRAGRKGTARRCRSTTMGVLRRSTAATRARR